MIHFRLPVAFLVPHLIDHRPVLLDEVHFWEDVLDILPDDHVMSLGMLDNDIDDTICASDSKGLSVFHDSSRGEFVQKEEWVGWKAKKLESDKERKQKNKRITNKISREP